MHNNLIYIAIVVNIKTFLRLRNFLQKIFKHFFCIIMGNSVNSSVFKWHTLHNTNVICMLYLYTTVKTLGLL